MAYNNTKIHKKRGFHSLFGRYIFRKTTGGSQIEPPAVLGLMIHVFHTTNLCCINSC